ncbi:MAG: fibronectin type III domain-containing protein [Firmicutes bacterium]|nr:fibronectin type III domain-containing protein [Bacillota bacterium]
MRKIRLTAFALISVVLVMILATATVFAAVDEREPNDSKQSANLIKMGAVVYGSTDDFEAFERSGYDWFKFTAPISGTAKLTLQMDANYSSSMFPWVTMDVFDSSSNEIAGRSDDLDTDGASSVTFGVLSGKTYYIRCYGGTYMNGGMYYHFKVGYSIGRTTITSAKGKKKALTVKWNKKAKASFYQVQYIKKGTYQDYGWNRAKTVKVSSKSKSRTIKKLAKKKTYYVRVRVARTISGVTYYSSWSPKRAVKTK